MHDELDGVMPEMPADCLVCGGWFELNDMDSCMRCSPRVMCRSCLRDHKADHERIDACECFAVPEERHTTYGDATEPGSMLEPNPECPVHGEEVSSKAARKTTL